MKITRYHYLLASLTLLLTCTWVIWQWRFERVSANLITDHALHQPDGWQGAIQSQWVKFSKQGLTMQKVNGGPPSSVSREIQHVESISYLSVKCDTAWHDCVGDEKILWAKPRIVIMGSDQAGRYSAPMDHGAVMAEGSREWHREHSVIELPPQMATARISIDSYGRRGSFSIKNLRVEAVQQRSWIIPATCILSGGWIAWFAAILRRHVATKWSLLRSLLLSSALFTAFWFLVFPQPRSLMRPLGMQFSLGKIIEPTPQSVSPVVAPVISLKPELDNKPAPITSTVRQPRLRTIAPPGSVEDDPSDADLAASSTDGNIRLRTIAPPPSLQTPPAELKPPPEVAKPPPAPPRAESKVREFLRGLDRKWYFRSYNLTHFTSFFGIALVCLILSGRRKSLIFVAALAVCGEVIPAIIHHIGDRGDWWDLCANFAGIGVALTLYQSFLRLIHRKKMS